MAVNSVPLSTALRLQLQTGVNNEGDPVFRNKNINNVKTQVEQQTLMDVAQALGQLQEHPLVSVLRIDSARLEEE